MPRLDLNSLPESKGPGRLDLGEFMSGNLLSKGLDLLGMTNYAAAGAVDAGLEGDNPLEGAWEGIKHRTTFSNVLEKRGAPGWVSKPVGLLADLIVPIAPGLGLARRAMEADKLGIRLAGMVRNRTLKEVMVGATEAGEAARHIPVDTVDFGAREAARVAFNRHADPVLGREAGRHAAATHGTSAEAVGVADALTVDRKFGPPGASTAPEWLKGVTDIKDKLFVPFKDFLEKHPKLGELGKVFSKNGQNQLLIEQALKGQLKVDYDAIIKAVPKAERAEFFDAIHAIKPTSKPHLLAAIAKHRKLSDEMFNILSELGVTEKNTVLTIMHGQHTLTEQQATITALARLAETAMDQREAVRAAMKAGSKAEKMAVLIDDAKGTLENGRVIMPLKRVDNYAALQATPLGLSHMKQKSYEEIRGIVMQLEPTMSQTEAGEAAMQFIKEHVTDPNGLRKTLQYQRGGRVVSAMDNQGFYELNPQKYLYKQIDDFASRAAQAYVWGGKDQAFDALRNEAKLLNGMSSVDDKISSEPGAQAIQALDRGFRILTGTYHDPMNRAIGMVSKLADILYLGPKTIIVQASNLPNIGALAGVGNSFAGMAAVMESPLAREIGQRLGVFLPSLQHAADQALVPKLVRDWNLVTRGVGKADGALRMMAAYTGGIHIFQLEKELKAAIQAGNAVKIRKVTKVLGRYGFEEQTIGKILEAGGQIPDEVFMRGMVQASNLTQFTGNVMDLPQAFQGPAGKFFLKFKQFSFQQTFFIDRLVKLAAEKGDYAPLLRYAAMLPWVYGPIFKVVNSMKEKPVENEDYSGVLQQLLQLGATGYIGEAAAAFASGSEALQLGSVAGANTSTIFKVAGSARNLTPLDFDPGKALEGMTPNSLKQMRNLVTSQ